MEWQSLWFNILTYLIDRLLVTPRAWFDADYFSSTPEVDPTGQSTAPTVSFVDRSRRSRSAVQEADTLRAAFPSYDGVFYPGENSLRLVESVSLLAARLHYGAHSKTTSSRKPITSPGLTGR
jgi:hypothetical protein